MQYVLWGQQQYLSPHPQRPLYDYGTTLLYQKPVDSSNSTDTFRQEARNAIPQHVAQCATLSLSKMTVYIRRLIWEPANRRHIARHQVNSDEVEEVCHGDPLVQQERLGRLGLIGFTVAGRLLKIILQPRGKNVYYPVTAHDADRGEASLYRKEKGVNDDEK